MSDQGPTTQELANPGWRGKLAWAALGFSALVVVWFALAAYGSSVRWWAPLYGFGTLATGWGSKLAMAALGFGVIALLIGVVKAPRVKPVILALFAILIAGTILGRLYSFRELALTLPPLHDVQTDWDDPIRFSEAMMAARAADGAINPVEDDPLVAMTAEANWPKTGGKRVADVQEAAENDPTLSVAPGEGGPYPQIATLYTRADPTKVYALAVDLVKSEGWEIVSQTPATGTSEGQIEATARTGAFGFKDDVAIRVRPTEDGGARVDMRSISRVGLSDIGANALRLSRYMDALARRVN